MYELKKRKKSNHHRKNIILQVLTITFLLVGFYTNAQVNFIKDRKHIQLTNWKFQKGVFYKGESKNFNDSTWQNIKVPHTYSMDAIENVGYYKGIAWYRTHINIPKSMENERVFLRFGAVGQEAIIYVNGIKIGNHIGGYSAFCYEITKAVKIGEHNLIVVKTSNAPNYKRIPVNDVLFNHYGGIYRSAQIFSTPKFNISPTFYASSGVFVHLIEQSKNSAKIEVRTHITNKENLNQLTLNYKILDANNQYINSLSKIIKIDKKNTIDTQSIEIENPILWNGRKNPYLYSVEVTLSDGKTSDKICETFGLRTFKVDADKGFFLNDEPYRIYGVAMHQEWQQVGPALTLENHKKDMEIIDEIGATGLRLSHYQHSQNTYNSADKLGLLVWTEIPFVHDYSGREQGNAKQQLTELIYQNYNHPSIFSWGLWNEVRAWKSADEPCVILTKELNNLAHKLDSTRFTVSASDRGMESNMGNISDLQAWNKYYGWYYGQYSDMEKWLDESRIKYPNIELAISEYGVGGNIYQQNRALLEKPIGNYFPEPVQTNYHEVTWKNIKERPFIWSSFIWNIFDFSVAGWNRGGIKNLNHKGLVTYDRKVKKDAFYFYKANWSDSPVLYIAELRNTKRTEAKTQVKVFTNLEKITLYINGRKIATKKQSDDYNTIIFHDILLKNEINKIEVKSKKGKEKFSHKAEWILSKK
ncbi:hypothetical protein BW723_15665 [Polaribacter reichenbachii]|uniref:Beta-galactosidase n=1 Tax=Polaribacter reichenbachii TaxID=996801 RepID=A0A1B8U567_9FLAO|nr:glycoside hydrolase family 2 [Polaribacter reichenbachii]APZ47637.1 hypothetical protein BW723_15665 [Polaribacter reichenbachii]AUC18277.1 hypothetical protein BTO17_06110 [Polaribacter reichenbachii]OBY67010.1 hypothetical protein LPB301_04120 [Polaribacter reichenbachii]